MVIRRMRSGLILIIRRRDNISHEEDEELDNINHKEGG